MRTKVILILLMLLCLSRSLEARLERHWTYQEMYAKSDLVAIADVVSTKDTTERTTLPHFASIVLVGVVTEFKISVKFKGPKDLRTFKLHHYRYQSNADEASVSDTPFLVKIDPAASYLLFLVKQPDGNYAPVTGQTDPAVLSVLDLHGAAD
jgi:hypothetical protein